MRVALNRASRESWPLFRQHQTPDPHRASVAERAEYEALQSEFRSSGPGGRVVPFISDMPEAFAEADLVLARSGAGSVGEIAAAGMPSILVPFPFAADDHQRKNAEALMNAGGAQMVPDSELTGERLFKEVEDAAHKSGTPGRHASAGSHICEAGSSRTGRRGSGTGGFEKNRGSGEFEALWD